MTEWSRWLVELFVGYLAGLATVALYRHFKQKRKDGNERG